MHDAAEARAAVEAARRFETFNLDLMYALPGQTLAEADLDDALAFAPPHLSVYYHLTIEPNTLFARGRRPALTTTTPADMLDGDHRAHGAAGLEHYETSAFEAGPALRAQPQLLAVRRLPRHRCRRTRQAELPAPRRAPGALARRPRALRMDNALAGTAISNERAKWRAAPFESCSTRCACAGFRLARFVERTGLLLSAIAAPLAEAQTRGLIEQAGGWLKPTPRGFDFLSDLQSLFLAD